LLRSMSGMHSRISAVVHTEPGPDPRLVAAVIAVGARTLSGSSSARPSFTREEPEMKAVPRVTLCHIGVGTTARPLIQLHSVLLGLTPFLLSIWQYLTFMMVRIPIKSPLFAMIFRFV
jgi:hypothetical protein